MSDVGLAKICKRHNIPLPPVGYWAKISHGKIVKKTSLVPLKDGEGDTIEIIAKMPSPLDDENIKDNSSESIMNAIGHKLITIAEFKRTFHPLIIESQKEYRERLKSYRNLQEGERLKIHNINVTKSSFDRASSLMNMLFQLMEINSLSLSRKPGYDGGTFVKINGIEIQIALKERTKRSENPDPKVFNKYEFNPTGILYFEIQNIYVEGKRKIWCDSQSSKLENVINEVGAGLVIAAINKKKQDLEREIRRQKDEAESEHQRLREEQLKGEKERVHTLLEEAYQWQTCVALRSYIKAVEEKYLTDNTRGELETELEVWIKWAKEKADIIDPVLRESWKSNSV